MVDLGETGPPPKSDVLKPLIDVEASEIRSVQLLRDDKPNRAQQVIDNMTPKDRAVFAFYLRELGYMVEEADAKARTTGR